MTKPISERERLLSQAKTLLERVNDLAVFAHVHGNPYTGPNIAEQIVEFILADRRSLLDKVEAEVIGGYEPETGYGKGDNEYEIHYDRNNLRNEQLTSLAQLRKEIG